jgi:DNA-binding transcriptional regulator YhcF (GntR family)
VRRALETGVLTASERLPSTRELAREIGADPRVVAAAYRTLAAEGLIAVRPRSGAYVAHRSPERDDPAVRHAAWITGVLAEGVMRGLAPARLAQTIHRVTDTRVRTVVIASTIDQTKGIAYELRTHYDIDAEEVLAEDLRQAASLPRPVQRARLLVTTEAHGGWVRRLAERLEKEWVVASVRPDLLSTEWLAAMRSPVFVIAADTRFLRLVRDFLSGAPGARNITLLAAANREAIAHIPADAATYVTQAARQQLGRLRLPGRLIPPTRIFAPDCIAAIVRIMLVASLGKTA